VSVSLFENKPESCPFGHQLWPGKAQVSWTPCLCAPARAQSIFGGTTEITKEIIGRSFGLSF
jgi:hypothetical protein